MTSTDIVKWRKTNDYENFEKGMIYMNILKKGGGGSREKGGGGNEIHAPCSCGTDKQFKSELKIIFSHGFIPKRVMTRQ